MTIRFCCEWLPHQTERDGVESAGIHSPRRVQQACRSERTTRGAQRSLSSREAIESRRFDRSDSREATKSRRSVRTRAAPAAARRRGCRCGRGLTSPSTSKERGGRGAHAGARARITRAHKCAIATRQPNWQRESMEREGRNRRHLCRDSHKLQRE